MLQVRKNAHLEEQKNAPPEPGGTTYDLVRRQTGLSFHNTRMNADRSLLSVISTSLTLISFGFTIFQIFRGLQESGTVTESIRNFCLSLLILGVATLIMGIVYHLGFMRDLRAERQMMIDSGQLFGRLSFPISMALVVALSLLILGMLTFFSMVTRTGPFI